MNLQIHKPFLIIDKYYQHLLFHLGQVILKILESHHPGFRKKENGRMGTGYAKLSATYLIYNDLAELKKKCASSQQSCRALICQRSKHAGQMNGFANAKPSNAIHFVVIPPLS